MQSCNRCNLTIRGDKVCCPLCGSELSGSAEPETSAYPKLPRKVTELSVVRVAAFCLIVLEIAMWVLQYMAGHIVPWAAFVMVGAPIAWLDLLLAFYFRNNVLRLVTYQTYIGMGVTLVLDHLTGRFGWAPAWIVPVCFVGLAVATICIGKGLRMLLEDYIIYLAVDLGLSFLQFIFINIGWNRFRWPAIISIALLLTMGAGALLFYFRAVNSAA